MWAFDVRYLALYSSGVVVRMALRNFVYCIQIVFAELSNRQNVKPPWLCQCCFVLNAVCDLPAPLTFQAAPSNTRKAVENIPIK